MSLSDTLPSHLALQGPEWWKSAVVYQVYPRSFQDSDGDGIGDLRGIIRRLSHLERLGIDVLWLSPVYASPQTDNGYDISDYDAIDPVYGTDADFDALVRDAHDRGIRIVMDLVVNHTSDQHPWFQESRSSLTNPKRDWYWWRDPRPGERAEPTNWESFFSGPTWTLDPATDQFYLHLFAPQQPDLNWENPAVRHEVYMMMRRWLDRGVDGFRMDVINLISKAPGLPDGDVRAGTVHGDGFPYYAHGPRLHEYLREMRREVFVGRGELLTVGEMPGVTTELAQLFTDPSRGELDMVFQFEHVGLDHGGGSKFRHRPLADGDLAASFTRWQDALAERGWNSLYLSNHDQPRAVSRFGDAGSWWRESATALATVLHMQRGTPYVFQGEELGMTNAPLPTIDDIRDVESLNHYLERTKNGDDPAAVMADVRRIGRDNARTPVQWDASSHAGFTDGEPWVTVNPNAATINAASQYGVPGSVFEHYRALISLRHTMPVIAHGNFERVPAGDDAVFAFRRQLGADVLLVIANLSSMPRSVTLTDASAPWLDACELLLTNTPVKQYPGDRFGPWEARIYQL